MRSSIISFWILLLSQAAFGQPKVAVESAERYSDFAHYEIQDTDFCWWFIGMKPDIYPLLPCVFFDTREVAIPDRYRRYSSPAQTEQFSDTTMSGTLLETHYDILNVIGCRLQRAPHIRLRLLAWCGKSEADSGKADAQRRAESIFLYMRDIWGISEERMKIAVDVYNDEKMSAADKAEYRRVDIFADDWWVMRSVLIWREEWRPDPVKVVFNVKDSLSPRMKSQRLDVNLGDEIVATLPPDSASPGRFIWNRQRDSPWMKRPHPQYIIRLVETDNTGLERQVDSLVVPIKQLEKRLEWSYQRASEVYPVVSPPENNPDMKSIQERCLREYIEPRIFTNSKVVLISHMGDKKQKQYMKGLKKRLQEANKEKGKPIETRYEVASPPLDNRLPEARIINRAILVRIETDFRELARQER